MRAAPNREDELSARIAELELRLEESEETLDAIRGGDIDALVVRVQADEHRIFTLETADSPYRVLIEQIQEGALTLTESGAVLYCNRCVAEMLECPMERIIGRTLQPFILAEDAARYAALLAEARHARTRDEFTLQLGDGALLPVMISLSPLQDERGSGVLCGVVADLRHQKLHLRELALANMELLAEKAERERVEDALRQAQKMEAVGQLTGGLAHDFNNLLTGIAGSLELIQLRVGQGRLSDVDRYIVAAQGAASRAAALTHRLLAFSRRQTLDPKPTDANALVAGLTELLERTVGPGITLKTVLADGLWPTLCDPGQLDNALLNLCINARDAMPEGGHLTIETGNIHLDARTAQQRNMQPGEFVTICVTDTGSGMSPEVIARAFDPFFTTKPIGSGTGLGLSMIYGFTRQSGGHAHIDSTVGHGTTVCLYLPRHLGAATPPSPDDQASTQDESAAGETVLLIDDEPVARMLVADMLGEQGYGVIEAADGPAGLEILASAAKIDLLVTDVGLPGGLNGRQVADAARYLRPGLRVLFVTGYADNAAIGNGQLESGTAVLTKPFAMAALIAKVRDMLDGGPHANSGKPSRV